MATALVINVCHIEPDRCIQFFGCQIHLRRAAEALLLAAIHKLPGQGDRVRPPELHLHDTDRTMPVPRHQVQFSEPAAPLALQQGVPLLPQIPGHRRFPPVSGALGPTHGAWPPTFSERSSGAPGRGRTDPASGNAASCRSPCAWQTGTGGTWRPAPWTHTGPG